MEKDNNLNPLISGGISIHNNDYFEKDNVNMENNSLKSSLALLTKIKNQKRGELNSLQGTYLKEESEQDKVSNNDNFQYTVPKELEKKKQEDTNTISKPSVKEEKKNSVTLPSYEVKNTTPPLANKTSSASVSFADYLKNKQAEAPQTVVEDKSQDKFDAVLPSSQMTTQTDEYLPDYKSPEYIAQAEAENNSDQQLGEPKYIVNGKEGRKKGKGAYVQTSSDDDIKSGKGIAWLAYIIFFIPLLFNGKNKYVRWHANEGFELFLMDIIGAGLFCVGWFLKSSNAIYTILLLASLTAGAVVVALSVFTRIAMIPFALAGKEVQHPWLFHKFRFIK